MQKLLSVKWGPAESELQHENGILSTNMMEQDQNQEHWHGHSNSINILVAVKAIKIGPVLIDSRGRGTSFCCFFFTNWSYTVLAGYTSYAPAQQTILLNLNCAIMILHCFYFSQKLLIYFFALTTYIDPALLELNTVWHHILDSHIHFGSDCCLSSQLLALKIELEFKILFSLIDGWFLIS